MSTLLSDDSDDPAAVLALQEQLYALAGLLYARGLSDPRLDPDVYEQYQACQYPTFRAPEPEAYPVPQPKSGTTETPKH